MKLDLLVFAAHPDDAELSCAGTILKSIKQGKKVGVIDLTQGEMGTRGTAKIRAKESANATKILGVQVRENLKMADGFLVNDLHHQLLIIEKIRQYQPEIILANAIQDRHPDHGKAAYLVRDAAFLSGLAKIETKLDGQIQTAWRPRAVYHYLQDRYIQPAFVVDISDEMEQKLEAIRAFKSQFFDPSSDEPATYISSPEYLETVIARNREMGKPIGATFGEAFTSDKLIGIEDIFVLK